MQEQHFDVFLSHNNKDRALVHEIALRLLDEADIASWLDAWHIPTGSDWEKEIGRALDTCNVFVVFLGKNGWSKYHLKESLIAIERQKSDPSYRIIPILLPGAKDSDFAIGDELFTHLKFLLPDTDEFIFSELINLFINKQRVDFRSPDGTDDNEAFQRLTTGISGKLPFPEGKVNASTIRRDALHWIEKGKKDKTVLYRGTKLKEAQKIAKESPERLNEHAIQFLVVSGSEEKLSKRRQRTLVFSLIGIAICALVTTGLAARFLGQVGIAQRGEQQAIATATFASGQIGLANATATVAIGREEEQATIARAGELASHSVALQNNISEFEVSLLLSVEAFLMNDNSQTQSALLDNTQVNPRLLKYLHGHNGYVYNLAFSPDGQILASGGGDDGLIILWDLSTGNRLGEIQTGYLRSIKNIAFSPDGLHLATTETLDSTGIILWDINTKKPKDFTLIDNNRTADVITYNKDGSMIASGNTDGSISIWNTKTGELIWSFNLSNPNEVISSLAFNKSGNIIAIGGCKESENNSCNKGEIILWDIEVGEVIGQPLIGHTDRVRSLIFVDNDKSLLSGTGGSNQNLILWDLTNNTINIQDLNKSGLYNYIATFSSDGNVFASGGALYDNTISIWNVETGETIGSPLVGHTDWVESIAFSPDGNIIASGSCGLESQGSCVKGEIIIWSVNTKQSLTQTLSDRSILANCIALSPNGGIIAIGEKSNKIILWDITRNEALRTINLGEGRYANHLAFSPNGMTLASGNNDMTITLWDIASGEELITPLSEYSEPLTSISFSDNGQMLAAGSQDNAIYLWDTKTGILLTRLVVSGLPSSARSLLFTPDGKFLVSGNSVGMIYLWDMETKTQAGNPFPFSAHGTYINSMTLNSHKDILATGGRDGTIFLWSTSTWEPIYNIPTDQISVEGLAFSPLDNNLLVSGGRDAGLVLWKIESKKPLGHPLKGYGEWIIDLLFDPSSNQVVTRDLNGKILIWNMSPYAWGDINCQRVGRNFSKSEWIKYFPNEEYRVTCPQFSN